MQLSGKLSHNWLAKKLTSELVRPALSDLRGIVIDLGCGTQPYRDDVTARAESYFGLDWPNSLHSIRPQVIADLRETLPFRDASIDAVLAFEVLEHLPEPGHLVSEAFRVLRPGGKILLSVPFQWQLHEAPWDFYRFTQYGLQHLLGSRGFERITITAKSGFWSMWALKLNYKLLGAVRGPRLLRKVIRLLLVPPFFANQVVAPLLDALRKDEGSTTGYFATARKP